MAAQKHNTGAVPFGAETFSWKQLSTLKYTLPLAKQYFICYGIIVVEQWGDSVQSGQCIELSLLTFFHFTKYLPLPQ